MKLSEAELRTLLQPSRDELRNGAWGHARLRPLILKEYVDLVFYKDLVERYKVANPALLRQLLKRCLGQPASLGEGGSPD
jgi:hypothetical protein